MLYLFENIDNSIDKISDRFSRIEAKNILKSLKNEFKIEVLESLSKYFDQSPSLKVIVESYHAENSLIDMGIRKDISELMKLPIFENTESFKKKMGEYRKYKREGVEDYKLSDGYIAAISEFSWNGRIKDSIDRYRVETERNLPKIMVKKFLNQLYDNITDENKDVYKTIIMRLEYSLGLSSAQIPAYIKSAVADYYYLLPELKDLADSLQKTDYFKNSFDTSVISYFDDTRVAKDKVTAVTESKDGKIVLIGTNLYKIKDKKVSLVTSPVDLSQNYLNLCESICRLENIDHNKYKLGEVGIEFKDSPIISVNESIIEGNKSSITNALFTVGFPSESIGDIDNILSNTDSIQKFDAIYVDSPTIYYTIIKGDDNTNYVIKQPKDIDTFVKYRKNADVFISDDALEYTTPDIVKEIKDLLGVDISGYFIDEIEANDDEIKELEFEKDEYEKALDDVDNSISKIEQSEIDDDSKKEFIEEAKQIRDETAKHINFIEEKLKICRQKSII